jgi:hypothetical protein
MGHLGIIYHFPPGSLFTRHMASISNPSGFQSRIHLYPKQDLDCYCYKCLCDLLTILADFNIQLPASMMILRPELRSLC